MIWFLPCDLVAAVRPNRTLLYHRDCTFFILKHRTCHSALHLLIIHAIMRYFYTIILFLLQTLIIIKALGSMHILRNQHFSLGQPLPLPESSNEPILASPVCWSLWGWGGLACPSLRCGGTWSPILLDGTLAFA